MNKIINLNNYSIVLLSAGIGRRLGEQGKKHPKCFKKMRVSTACVRWETDSGIAGERGGYC